MARPTAFQRETLRLINGGLDRSPPLIHKNVRALLKKGLIRRYINGGMIRYGITDEGKKYVGYGSDKK